MRKLKFILPTSALIILVVSLTWYSSRKTTVQNLEYITNKIEIADIKSYVSTSGTVTAVGLVEVGSQLSGQVLTLKADFNDLVVKDQILAIIDQRTFEARVRQDIAQVEIAKANLTNQKAAQYKAKVQMLEAKRVLSRFINLGVTGHTSESETDRLKSEHEASKAQLRIADAQVINAQAVVRQREEALTQSRLTLEQCIIRSPVDGMVIERSVELGQTVAASFQAPKLFVIAQDLKEMQLEASVDEADIGKIKVGQQTEYTVDAYPEDKFFGGIIQIRKSPIEIQNVVTYRVIISAPNPEEKLLPGMTATLEVTLGERKNVLLVPNTALRFKPKANSGAKKRDRRQEFNPEKIVGKLVKKLRLDDEQKQIVTAIYKENFDRMKGVPAWRRQSEMQVSRRRIQSAVNNILSSKQKELYSKVNDRSAHRKNKKIRPGQVWRLDKDGKPESVRVRLGLSDDENTEIISGDVKEGDKVIIRTNLRRS